MKVSIVIHHGFTEEKSFLKINIGIYFQITFHSYVEQRSNETFSSSAFLIIAFVYSRTQDKARETMEQNIGFLITSHISCKQ